MDGVGRDRYWAKLEEFCWTNTLETDCNGGKKFEGLEIKLYFEDEEVG